MKLASIAAATALAACAGLPPSRDNAASLAAAESAFAAHSVREDMRSAFLAHFADDGVLVGEKWSTARELLGPRPAPPIVLDWRPVYVEAAASGEMGLSTGPWKRTPNTRDRPPAYGQFVSIWKREANGTWRVAVDIGIAHPEPVLWDAPLVARHTPGLPGASSLDDAERDFARRAAASGLKAAYAALGTQDLRVYRGGMPPTAQRDASIGRAAGETAPAAWVVERSEVAASGDFGYARGHYLAGADPARSAGHFLRAWRREPEGWRIVLDVTNPASR